jgi:serine/threonine-protein kinase
LKPENIFMIHRGEDKDFVKLLDFGIAKLSSNEDSPDKPKTRMGMILGTPEYMSPEQAGGRVIDYRSDLYSLGVVTYWMLSDQLPYRGKSFGELMVKQLTTAPTQLPEKTPSGEPIPPALSQLIYRCLEREPQNRIQSAGEILEALNQGGSSPKVEAPLLLTSKTSRARWMVPALVGAALAAVGLAVWHFSGSSETKETAAPPVAAAPAEPSAPSLPLPPPPSLPAPSPAAALPAPVPAPAVPAEKAAAPEAKSHTKATAAGAHKKKRSSASPAPDDNTGMIDPFAN